MVASGEGSVVASVQVVEGEGSVVGSVADSGEVNVVRTASVLPTMRHPDPALEVVVAASKADEMVDEMGDEMVGEMVDEMVGGTMAVGMIRDAHLMTDMAAAVAVVAATETDMIIATENLGAPGATWSLSGLEKTAGTVTVTGIAIGTMTAPSKMRTEKGSGITRGATTTSQERCVDTKGTDDFSTGPLWWVPRFILYQPSVMRLLVSYPLYTKGKEEPRRGVWKDNNPRYSSP